MNMNKTEASFCVNIVELYKMLGNSNMNYSEGLHELIDNSYSSTILNTCNIEIDICGDWENYELIPNTVSISIKDNGSGIPREEFISCLSPGRISKNPGSLNMFGAGIKNSLMTLGCSRTNDSIGDFEIISKISSEKAYMVNKISQTISIFETDWNYANDSGTIINIRSIRNFPLKMEKIKYLRNSLGVRYQNYLNKNQDRYKKMNIILSLKDSSRNIISDKDGSKCQYDILPSKPLFKEQNIQKNKIFSSGTGGKWRADVMVNYRPSKDGIAKFTSNDAREQESPNHPYYFALRKVDIIYGGIVIEQMSMSKFRGVLESSNAASSRNELAHMSIILDKGFELTNTKNSVKDTDAFNELRQQIREWYSTKEVKDKIIGLSEKEIQNKMQNILEIGGAKVNREPTIKFGQKPDFIFADTCYEIKKGEASSRDVMQAINYCVLTGMNKIVLIADHFNENAKNIAKDYLKELFATARQRDPNDTIEVKLEPLSKILIINEK